MSDLKLTGIQEIGDEKYAIKLGKINLSDIEIIKTDGKATHIQLPLEVGECGFVLRESYVANRNGFKNDSEGQVLFNQTNIKNEGEVDNMKFNLIPNLIFTNDRGETFRVETQEVVIRIGNNILLKHTPDIIDKLDKIFEGAKQVIVKLEYHTLDENEQSLGITTRQVYVKTYEVREYYNTKKDKNDMIYLFSWEGCLGNEVKELLEEYRHRQMLESLNSYRTCDEDSCFGVKRISEILSK